MSKAEKKGSELRVCKYYNGVIRNKVCKKGRKYEEMYNDNGVAGCEDLPCTEWTWERRAREWCKDRELVSEEEKEEMERREEELITLFDNTIKVLTEVRKGLGEWKSGEEEEGEIGCSICGEGRIRYTRSGYNGNVKIRCTTKGCIGWDKEEET